MNSIEEVNNLKKVIVQENEQGKRIDQYLAEKEDISRVSIKRMLESNIRVNNNAVKASYKVQNGDVIYIEAEEPEEAKIEAQDIPLDIIYEDEDMIVVNKAKGMVVHPAHGNLDGTVVNAIMAVSKESLSGIGGEIRPGIVHRLDKDTSGVLMIAKNDKTHISLSEQIKNHKVEKTYIALVRGFVKANEATIDMPIGRAIHDRKKMSVTKTGKNAVTHFKVLERFKDYTLLEVRIETGRTHQIRVHLAEIGHPVVGDFTYSNGKNKWGIQGQCLHAKSLKFKHPTTGKQMEVEAPLPEYLEKIILELRGAIHGE